ncbi:hypothetical protein TNCT_249941 [Trichonephila clavata]|uniref:Uncharacterized protein n=1 Tax=Trichonephila clavata TaxID=2740835 RepID=A0A8X6JSM9_TRICU|nr:hypothetical protein TNCT_249941 [Trichonephila clavata]
MASHLFQYVRRELVGPFARKNMRFASDLSLSVPSSTSSSPSPTSSPSSKKLTDTERRVRMVLKTLAIFLPGVLLGQWLGTKGMNVVIEPTDGEKDDEKTNKKNKNLNEPPVKS